jgi:hypothetical protein
VYRLNFLGIYFLGSGQASQLFWKNVALAGDDGYNKKSQEAGNSLAPSRQLSELLILALTYAP